MLERIKNTASFIQDKTKFYPEVGIILGTGLGGLVKEIKIEHTLDYEDIPGFPVSTVEGHHGRLIFGELGGKKIVAMQGRFHFYEGYPMEMVIFSCSCFKIFRY
jgi:purine-nucleoside phosphorylase